MNIRLELDDGRIFEAEGNEKTMNCLADRIRFEKQFGVSSAAMSGWDSMFNSDGTPREGADVGAIREEWLSFVMWCELKRRAEGVPDWAEVIEHVIELTATEPEAPDPTATTS